MRHATTIRAARPDPTPLPKITPHQLNLRPTRRPTPPARTAMPKSISGARSGPMPPMPRRPIRTRAFTRNPPTPGQCCASWGEEDQKTIRGIVFPTTALMENRSGLIVQGDLTQANGHAAGPDARLGDRHLAILTLPAPTGCAVTPVCLANGSILAILMAQMRGQLRSQHPFHQPEFSSFISCLASAVVGQN